MYQAIIIDDDPLVLEGLKAALDWSSFHFEIAYEATNPLLALDYLKGHPTHLLVTDISMPELSGIELIRQAKMINPEISILVLSAYDTFDYVKAVMRHGAENYLLKPLNPDELSESLRSVTTHLQERRELTSIYGSSMQTFRSSFIESWVHGSLNDDDFLTRAELLGINLQQDNYTVLIFSAATDVMPLLLDRLMNLFLGKYLSHFYLEGVSRLVCVVSTDSPSLNTDSLLSALEEMRPTLSYSFFVAVGPTAEDYEKVSDSYYIANRHMFLQYSSMTSINCQEMALPVTAQRLIEQPYTDIEEDTYLKSMMKLISSPVSDTKRMAYQLAVIYWGICQCNFESTPDDRIKRLLSRFVYDINETDKIEEYLKELFETVIELLTEHQEIQSSCYPVVDAAIAAVHDFSNKNISLKTLAANLNIHPSYLGSIFHQQTGFYFNDYLNNVRLEQAAKLMESTDLKMKEIVERTGFSSQTYFNRLFKQKYGVPPLTYRTETRMSTYK